jgi:hypothetical protein
MLRGVIAVLPFVLAACEVKVDCGGKPSVTLDDEASERNWKAALPGAQVDCVDGVELARDAQMPCRVTLDGRVYDVRMVLVDYKGASDFQTMATMDGRPVYPTAELATFVETTAREQGVTLDVDCGDPLRTTDADGKLRCTTTHEGQAAVVVIEFGDDRHLSRWNLEPAPK